MISNFLYITLAIALLCLAVAGLACVGMWLTNVFRHWRMGGWEIGHDRKEIRILTRITMLALFGFSAIGGVWMIWWFLVVLHILPFSD